MTESSYPKYLIPRVTPEAEEFFQGAARRELRLQRCASCGLHQHYPRSLCSHCGGADLGWVTASGRGTVYSFTVIRQNAVPPFDRWVPFVVALVELEESGVRLLATMPHVDPNDVRVGLPVVAAFRRATDRVTLVDFAPAP
jgi:uncharacterized OB-fold protein